MKLKPGKLYRDVSLANYTSWRVGGPAKQLFLPKDSDDLVRFIASLADNEPLLWLGLGSNTLIRDGGFPGTVIVTQASMNSLTVTKPAHIRAEAGVACAALARFTARQNLSGLEFMAGIPGTVGGALQMNAGCFQGETWDYVVAVETVDQQGRIQRCTPDQFQITYRRVVAKQAPMWFLAAHFKLPPGNKQQSLELIRELLARRADTQPTGDHSCGSVFRNPPNDYAGRLIEACGLKGYQHGGAEVSPRHANFIINTGTATASDIEALIELVHARVQEKFAIALHREVHIHGVSLGAKHDEN
jgi:UDP-N-acetylmuramate dehydrogenase